MCEILGNRLDWTTMNFPRPPHFMAPDMSGLVVNIHINGPRIFTASDLDEYWWSYSSSGMTGHATFGDGGVVGYLLYHRSASKLT